MKMGSASWNYCDGILIGVISYRDCHIVVVVVVIIIIIIIIIIIGSAALGGP